MSKLNFSWPWTDPTNERIADFSWPWPDPTNERIEDLEAENAALKKWNLEYDDKNAALRALLKEAAEFVRWADTFNLDDATARRNWEELKRKLEACDE